MRAFCSTARSSLPCSVLRILQRPDVSAVQRQTSRVANDHPGLAGAARKTARHLELAERVASSRATQRPSSSTPTPRFIVRSGDGATDSMERNLVELEVKVEGMKCGGCSSRVEEALKALDHVKGVQVDLDTKLATVEVEADNLIDAMNMLPTFVTTIKELGFEAEPHIEYQL